MALRSITLSSVSRVSSTTWNAVLITKPTQGLCFCIGNVPGLYQELCLFCVGIVAQWIEGDKHGTVRHSTVRHGISRFQSANHNVAISHFNDQMWHGLTSQAWAAAPFITWRAFRTISCRICLSVKVVDERKRKWRSPDFSAVVIGVSQFDVCSAGFWVIPCVNQPKCHHTNLRGSFKGKGSPRCSWELDLDEPGWLDTRRLSPCWRRLSHVACRLIVLSASTHSVALYTGTLPVKFARMCQRFARLISLEPL